MPSPERPGGFDPERSPEQEPKPWYQAARFDSEPPARKAYFQAQELLRRDQDNELSAYRFLLNQVSHVSIVGDEPRAELAQQIEAILSTGEPASLPPEILQQLFARRAQMVRRHGSWSERHYRPGRRF